jgi:hypothetical protein
MQGTLQEPLQAAAAPASAPTSGSAPIAQAGEVKTVADATKVAAPAGLTESKSWFKQVWDGLDSSQKLAAGQTASGFVKGVGEGGLKYMAAGDQRKYEQELLDRKRQNLSGVPKAFQSSGLIAGAR